MTILDTRIPAQPTGLLWHMRRRWRVIQRNHRGIMTDYSLTMRLACRMAIREINTELIRRKQLRKAKRHDPR